ncbi:MAG: tripartite tricarboxylate transporter substrate binding protein, partial [Proteobacteria bacterium]
VKDLAPITTVADAPLVLVVAASSKFKTLADVVAASKAKPGDVTFATPGNGTVAHLTGELFQRAAGIKLQHIPYKGSSQAITDLMGGTVDAMFATLTVVLPHIASGKLTALAVANGTRVEKVPQIPTFAEGGMKNFEAATWFGLLAPASMPRPLREQISKDVRAVVAEPELRSKLIDLGGEVVNSQPSNFDAFMQAETKKWQEVVRTSGAVAD